MGQILLFADEKTEVHKDEVSSPPKFSHHLVSGLLTELFLHEEVSSGGPEGAPGTSLPVFK